jgi:hypothetical protein
MENIELDNNIFKITGGAFSDMIKRVNTYITDHHEVPKDVFVTADHKQGWFTYSKYEEIKARWDKLVTAEKPIPDYVWSTEPQDASTETKTEPEPQVTVPPIIPIEPVAKPTVKPEPTKTVPQSQPITLQKGSSGSSVKTLQNLCNVHGFLDLNYHILAEDGTFGAMTESAVKKFQAIAGIKQDGIFGSVSQSAMTNYIKQNPLNSFITILSNRLATKITNMQMLYKGGQKKGKYRGYDNCQMSDIAATNEIVLDGINCCNSDRLVQRCVDEFNAQGKNYALNKRHVSCKKANGAEGEGHYDSLIIGEEFTKLTLYDFAEAIAGHGGWGSSMCIYGLKVLQDNVNL